MNLELARIDAQANADESGYQFLLVNDPIANGEEASGTYGYFATLALPIFIRSMRRGGEIVEVVEPKRSAADRRKAIEDDLVARFRKDPNSVPAR